MEPSPDMQIGAPQVLGTQNGAALETATKACGDKVEPSVPIMGLAPAGCPQLAS